MHFNTNALKASYEAWEKSAGTFEHKALSHNFRFEELISKERLADYESKAANSNFALSHKTYFTKHIKVKRGVPDCFNASLQPASILPIEEEQWIIRLEEIGWVLGDEFKFDDVKNNLSIRKQFLDHWNGARSPYPAFAAFKNELTDEIKQDNFANLFRDKLGLAHFQPKSKPIHVALMHYKVSEVLKQAKKSSVDVAFTKPTVLDSDMNSYYFPAPSELPFGRTLDLSGKLDSCAEILHSKIDYKMDHFLKFGVIDADYAAIDLKNLRNNHLSMIRTNSNRADFGEELV